MDRLNYYLVSFYLKEHTKLWNYFLNQIKKWRNPSISLRQRKYQLVPILKKMEENLKQCLIIADLNSNFQNMQISIE